MNEKDLQSVEDNLRNAFENLLHVESVLSLLSTQAPNEADCSTQKCLTIAQDILSDATNDLKSPIATLITELRRRIEHRGVVVPINE